MDRKKIFKNNSKSIIKMDVMNMMRFKDFQNCKDFNIKIDPFTKQNRKEVESLLLTSKDSKKYIFEWLDFKTKVKPYYDIDMFYESQEEQESNTEIIKEQVLETLKKHYPESTIAISSSHGAKTKSKTVKKVRKEIKGFATSFHFVVSDYECSVEELREFNEKNKLYDLKIDGTNEKLFDKAVYRDGGNMRFLYSYKPNDPRQKIPENYKDSYMITKHIIQSTPETNHFKRTLPNASPPSSPPISPKVKVKVEEVIEEEVIEEDLPPFVPIKEYNIQDVADCLKYLDNEDCFEYETWIKIGMAIHNITDGDMVGLGLYIDFSKKDEDNYDNELIRKNWKYWDKSKNNGKNKVGMTTLKKLANKYKPIDVKTSCEHIFKRFVQQQYDKNVDFMGEDIKYEMFFKSAEKKVLQFLNTKLIFVRETGDYIILDSQQIKKENEETITKPSWYLKTPTKAKDHFKKENFKASFGEEESYKMNPFEAWCNWIDRREVRAIGFDPSSKPCDDIFNLWNGFNISKEEADEYNEEDAEPILEHMKELWCNDDETSFNYVMDLFAHYIQKPHIKTGVLLALKSKQGGGKGIILNKLAEIIGDDHYVQNSNADYLFGNFNGQLEGKIVCNLDEAFWGGDKKMEGMVKNKITEKRQTINKKNKEAYSIDDYVNYIITTNNDWFSGVSADDRRHYCLQLSDFLCGRMTEEKMKIVQPVLDAPAEAFAKVLYNRDISEFNPRIFNKTKLLQDQVERNWNSVKTWFHMALKDGGMYHPRYGFAEWGELWVEKESGYGRLKGGVKMKNKKTKQKEVAYFKEYIFECYNSTSSDNRKFGNEAFFKEFKLNCLKDIYMERRVQIKKERRVFVVLPTLDKARENWNKVQEFKYIYGDVDDDWDIEGEYFSDDEDDN